MKNNFTFQSRQIKGKGRGKKIGLSTINLAIPNNFSLKNGIYATWVKIGDKKHKGALHFGPTPTFKETKKSLEIFIIDWNDNIILTPMNRLIEVEIIKRIRDVLTFKNQDELIIKIKEDIKEIKKILQIPRRTLTSSQGLHPCLGGASLRGR